MVDESVHASAHRSFVAEVCKLTVAVDFSLAERAGGQLRHATLCGMVHSSTEFLRLAAIREHGEVLQEIIEGLPGEGHLKGLRSLVGDVKGPCFHTIHLSLNKFEIWFGWEICSSFDTNYGSLFPILQEHFVLRGEMLLGDDVLLI